MEIGINDLDFMEPEVDDEGHVTGNYTEAGEEKPWVEEGPQYTDYNSGEQDSSNQEEEGFDLLTELLKSKGISDPSRIKFADENDEIQERDWNSLTPEEQYNILATPNEQPDYLQNTGIDDSEAELINLLRTNQLTPDEFINTVKQQGVQEYLAQAQPENNYTVDGISDDDLYIIDLAARTPGITDDELLNALDAAKQNPELFAKQMSGIRQEYKELEEQNNSEQQAIAQQQEQELYQEFSNNIFTSIDDLSEIGGLDITLDDDDKEELAEFILGRDQAGINYLAKALNDPDTLTKMAWFALKGPETIDGVVDYFTKEITRVRKNSYQEGYEAAKAGKTPSVVISKPSKVAKEPSKTDNIETVDDLDFYNE